MTTKKSSGYSDLQYFSQLRRQADESLGKTERSASSLVAQVLQVHALLGATVGVLPVDSSRGSAQRSLQQGALGRMRQKIGSLKTEVSGMLQEIVIAEAAMIGLEAAVHTEGAAQLATPSMLIPLPGTAPNPLTIAISPKMVAVPTYSSMPPATSLGSTSMPAGSSVKETVAGVSEGVGMNVFSITTAPEEPDANKGRASTGGNGITATRDGVSVVSIAEAPGSMEGSFTPSPNVGTLTKKGTSKTKLPTMTCKICTRAFKYRTPLIKHFSQHRETQAQQVDLSNYHLFVDFGEDTDAPKPATDASPAPQSSPAIPTVEAKPTRRSPRVTVKQPAKTVEGDDDDTPPDSDSPREETPPLDCTSSQSLPPDASAAGSTLTQVATSLDLALFPNVSAVAADNEPPAKKAKVEKKVFTCVVCSKSFSKPNKLMRHMSIHDPERPRVVCKLCSRSFIRYQSLFQHVQSLHPAAVEGLQLDADDITCKYCSRTFTRIESLYDHIQAKHAEHKREVSAEEDGVVTKPRRRRREGGNTAFRCTTCGEMFTQLARYKEHACPGNSSDPEQMIRCIHCSLAFPSQQDLSSHQASAHQFSCDICSRTFLHEAYLNVHKVIHSGPGRFTCQECQLSMEELDEYQKHIKTHPNYTPYKCTGCGKAFPFPSLMVMHKCSPRKAVMARVAREEQQRATSASTDDTARLELTHTQQ